MRTNLAPWTTVLIVTASCWRSTADEPAGIRELERFDIRGVEKVSRSDIRAALRDDFDLLLAGHPDAALDGYLRAIEATTLLAYHHSGFAGAKIAARYDEELQQIIVEVEEGPRHLCGAVIVHGASQADIQALIAAVSEPAGSHSRPWTKDWAAPFDGSTLSDIRKRLKEAFAAQGFLSPSFDIKVESSPNESAATLQIRISNEGPRAKIGKITIAGNERDSDADILNYLDLHPDQRYDSGLPDRLKARLDDSGRFLSAKIDWANAARAFEFDSDNLDLSIELRDYEAAPPLAADFSPEQKAALQFRDWLGRWSRGKTDYDIVCEGSFSAAAMTQICSEMDMPMPPIEDMGVKRCDLRVVIAPQRGLLIAAQLFNANETVLFDEIVILHQDHVLIAAPQRQTRLKWTALGGNQMTLNLEAKAQDKPDEDDRLFKFMAGLSFRSRNRADRPAVPVKADVAVAAMLSVLSWDEVRLVRDGALWNLERKDMPGALAKIDAETGRLIKSSGKMSPDNEEEGEAARCEFALRTDQGAWQREIESVDSKLAGAKDYDATSPWKSLAEFAADELIFGLRQQGAPAENIAAVEAGRKLFARWSLPALLDGQSPKAPDDSDDESWFELPPEKTLWTIKGIVESGQLPRSAVASGLVAYRRLVPRESWLWPTGRDVALHAASDSRLPLDGLWTRVRAGELGPLGCWLIGSSIKQWKPALAKQALHDMSVEGFRKDYQPLLSGDGWLSQCILSLADAARSLDETDLRALVGCIDDGIVRELSANWLLTLKEEREKPVARAVSRMLDALWAVGLRDTVAKTFRKSAAGSTSTETNESDDTSLAQRPKNSAGEQKK